VADKEANRAKVLIALHALLLLFSTSGIFSKLASGYPFMSAGFIICYGGMVCVLGVYAIGWQQIIKRLPLTTAYANRAVTVVWGVVWGTVLFGESVTLQKVLGAVVVLFGVALYALAGDDENASNGKPEKSGCDAQ
jgi:drug/metabolite transporter (DMT)-like permease